MGIWPTKKALLHHISAKWKPKAHFNMQLGSKGFFTIIFTLLEDKDRVLEGEPYFFNSIGLFLRNWVERFNPDTEKFSWALVWVRLYSLPQDYWDEETPKDVSNALGYFVKVVDQIRQQRYTSYAHICVYMHIAKTLPDSIILAHEDT